MQQEPADELLAGNRHLLVLLTSVLPVVFVLKGNGVLVNIQESLVGDGDAMRVTPQVLQNLLWPAEGRFGIDDPIDIA